MSVQTTSRVRQLSLPNAAGMFVAALAACFIALFLYLALQRLGYPFELEWLEGSVADNTARLAEGLPIYASPSIDFCCYVYPPLYYYVTGWFVSLIGPGFSAFRLVSLLASVGTLALIYGLVAGETGLRRWGWFASGLYAATYHAVAAWFDIARVDALFLFFTLAGVVAVRRLRPTMGTAIFAGCLFFLAAFTKQSALGVAAAMAVYLALVNWRCALGFAATLGSLVGISTAILNRVYDGWYTYCTVEILGTHSIVSEMWVGFWTDDVLCNMPVAMLLAIVYLARCLGSRSVAALFYPLLAGSAFAISWAMRLHHGGAENAFMPAFATLAILSSLALAEFCAALDRSSARRRAVGAALMTLGCVIQLGVLFYDPRELLPTSEDRAAGERFLGLLRGFEGEVYAPYNGYVPRMAGKRTHGHFMTVWDVFRGNDLARKKRMYAEMEQTLAKHRFSAVILPETSPIADMVERHYYRSSGHIFASRTAFFPVTGFRTRPEYVYLPRESEPRTKSRPEPESEALRDDVIRDTPAPGAL